MCMKLNSWVNKIPRYALLSRKTYKVMQIDTDNVDKCYSPHRYYEYTIGATVTAKITIWGTIVYNGLHSFTNVNDAIEECRRLNNHASLDALYYIKHDTIVPRKHYEVFECIIPAGSIYYRGLWEYMLPNSIKNIVSNKLIVSKKIVKDSAPCV